MFVASVVSCFARLSLNESSPFQLSNWEKGKGGGGGGDVRKRAERSGAMEAQVMEALYTISHSHLYPLICIKLLVEGI